MTSKLMGLSPIFLSIMVASRKAPKRKNSSIFPVQFCRENPRDQGSGQPEGCSVLGKGVPGPSQHPKGSLKMRCHHLWVLKDTLGCPPQPDPPEGSPGSLQREFS